MRMRGSVLAYNHSGAIPRHTCAHRQGETVSVWVRISRWHELKGNRGLLTDARRTIDTPCWALTHLVHDESFQTTVNAVRRRLWTTRNVTQCHAMSRETYVDTTSVSATGLVFQLNDFLSWHFAYTASRHGLAFQKTREGQVHIPPLPWLHATKCSLRP